MNNFFTVKIHKPAFYGFIIKLKVGDYNNEKNCNKEILFREYHLMWLINL